MGRNLVIFSDCCWQRTEYRSKKRQVPSNISLAQQSLAPISRNGREQLGYPALSDASSSKVKRLARRLFGAGLKAEIFDAYSFLAHTYKPDDQIYMFGAGLGAFNLRRLVDMIDRVGLLLPEDIAGLADAFEYSQIPVEALDTPAAQNISDRLDGRKIEINFLGCLDTIGSYGLPTPGLNKISQSWMMLHDHKINSNVSAAYQALALDEKRSRFRPGIWTGAQSPEIQAVEQVWFAGSHENTVGGRRDSGLSDIALNWLLRRAEYHGLQIDHNILDEFSAPDPGGKISNSKWRLLTAPLSLRKARYRPVGQSSPGFADISCAEPEKLHETVLVRQKTVKKYSPHQLASLQAGAIPVFSEREEAIQNRRLHQRFSGNWPAILIDDEGKTSVSLIDYSQTGARIWAAGSALSGTTYLLKSSLKFMNGLKSRVIWAKDGFIGLKFDVPLSAEHIAT
ncbi:DUF2235 domain-containing protein [Sneathiella marina]|uniref:DUF2235 domain-containing protein n=1 Tax=Sneathiella marina TaxID=2950108 RepID=A0ABY4VYZ3_9PROT|nr:DUF2235 domain-containing protein [Sneathiella marina]USG59819.1 DUF2235 domain-containing protein [Sneathiella marina]